VHGVELPHKRLGRSSRNPELRPKTRVPIVIAGARLVSTPDEPRLLPALTANEYGAVPPLAEKTAEYDRPAAASPSVPGVMSRTATLMFSVYVRDPDDEFASVAVTVNV